MQFVKTSFSLVLVFSSLTYAATLPAGFTETQISGLSNPTAMEIAPDGRIFVCQQGGSLRVIKNGALLPTPFITLSVDSSGERGLLGIAFDPNFATNNFLYLYYTVPTTPRHNRVSRFTANGDVVVPGSERLFSNSTISLEQQITTAARSILDQTESCTSPSERMPRLQTRKRSATCSARSCASIQTGPFPPTIPFSMTRRETIARSGRSACATRSRLLSNPERGRLFINDVGQDTWEEINDGIAGSNYGWPTTEGATSNPSFRSPLFSYAHGIGSTVGCAIAGGAFYNPATVRVSGELRRQIFFCRSVQWLDTSV